MRLIWALDHNLQLTSKRMATTMGLTGPQRIVIRLLGQFPGISAGSLALMLHVHPSTLTGVLKRLETRGLIWRNVDPRDGRRALLGLTAEGRQLDVPAQGTVEAAIEAGLSKLAPEKLAAAAETLGEISRALADQLGPQAA